MSSSTAPPHHQSSEKVEISSIRCPPAYEYVILHAVKTNLITWFPKQSDSCWPIAASHAGGENAQTFMRRMAAIEIECCAQCRSGALAHRTPGRQAIRPPVHRTPCLCSTYLHHRDDRPHHPAGDPGHVANTPSVCMSPRANNPLVVRLRASAVHLATALPARTGPSRLAAQSHARNRSQSTSLKLTLPCHRLARGSVQRGSSDGMHDPAFVSALPRFQINAIR